MNSFECTVVCLTCNRPDWLAPALRSIDDQVLRPASVIISDDSQGDESERLVQSFERLPTVYRRGPRCGQSANLRSALSLVTTELVVVLHDDDWWEPELLERASIAFREFDLVDIFVPGLQFVDAQGGLLPRETDALRARRATAFSKPFTIWETSSVRAEHLLARQVVSMFQGTVVRVSAIRSWLNGPPRNDLEDLFLCAELARPSSGPLGVYYDSRFLCNYRVHADSVAARAASYMDHTIAAFEGFRDDSDFASIQPALERRVRERAYQAALQRAADGDRVAARELMRRHCGAPRSRREAALAVALRLPISPVLRRALARRNPRYS